MEEATTLMEKVPSLLQRIAGKSIPMEKLISRKARKFKSQGHRLVLPLLELGYLFLAVARAPRSVLAKHFLVEIRKCLDGLKEREKLVGYYDDLCICKLLEGVCLRYLAHPVRHYFS